MRASGGAQSRFVSYKADPSRTMDLPADHPAVVDGRTLFPSTVVGAFDSPRFLVSGKNSSKTGAMVTKGPWKGMPIYTLTLEERATCPRSCAQWAGCYGSSMHKARRNDAYDPDFIPALKAEVITLVREVCAPLLNKPDYQPPRGVVLRLHVLGDFFSVPYVRMWADLLDHLPELHVWGYTARSEEADDAESRRIARGLRYLTDEAWDRFAVRWSRAAPGPQRSIVVDEPVEDDPNIVMCPQQEDSTDVCATCGLCWAPALRGKTIGFLKHGRKSLKGTTRPPLQAPPVTHDLGGFFRMPASEQKTQGRKRFIPSATDASGKVVRPWMVGSAGPFDAAAAQDRLDALDAAEKDRITAAYGATFKDKA